jgi:hypothetical protein
MFIARIVDVFYDGEHLKSRNDLAQICTRTLNALLGSESPALRGAVGNELLPEYLDFKQGFVYKDWAVELQFDGFDSDGLVRILETIRATVIPNPGRSTLEFRWTWHSPNAPRANANLLSMSIDGHNIPLSLCGATPDTDGVLRSIYTHSLSGQTASDTAGFELVRRVRKLVDVAADPVTIYRFAAPSLSMSVHLLDFPEDKLTAELVGCGLPRDFQPDRQLSDGCGQWRSQKYIGLIFPRQGAILQLFLK